MSEYRPGYKRIRAKYTDKNKDTKYSQKHINHFNDLHRNLLEEGEEIGVANAKIANLQKQIRKNTMSKSTKVNPFIKLLSREGNGWWN